MEIMTMGWILRATVNCRLRSGLPLSDGSTRVSGCGASRPWFDAATAVPCLSAARPLRTVA